MRVSPVLALAVVLLGSAVTVRAGSPLYESWAKYKPGTTVVMRGATEAAGMRTDTEQTYTLKEATPEKVVVEVKSSVVVMGNKTEMPASTIEIPAGDAKATPPGQPPAGAADVKRSDDKVTVAGHTYTATCVESTFDRGGVKVTTKTWTSPEIPGMTAKTESTSAGAVPTSVRMEITTLELK